MKPAYYKIPFSSDVSFLFKKFECDHFSDPWHFHSEYEIVMVDKGSGTKFIGDNVSHFEKGDLTFIGPNIPHFMRNSEEYYHSDNKLRAGATYLHFTKNFLGAHFFNLPEMKLVNDLLEKSKLALKIKGSSKQFTINRLKRMVDEKPPQRLLSLLEILIHLSQSQELKPLLSMAYTVNKPGDTDRINEVFEFILKNYTRKIYIQKIADQLHMSVPSFSRYFKHHTSKTFSNYVTEIRIGHAKRLLMENDHNISEICFHCGFNNLSNFYRHFRKLTGVVPKEYKDRFLKVPL